MGIVERFNDYAGTFEVAFESDDFSVLEPFFTEDAVYETIADPPLGGRQEGRDTIFEYMKASVSGFDRRFEKREPCCRLLQRETQLARLVWSSR